MANAVTPAEAEALYQLTLDGSSVSRDLTLSVAARALVAAGELLGALERQCLPDTFALWRRLCVLADWPDLERMQLDAVFPSPDPWRLVRESIIAACRNADALDAKLHWYRAEIAVRRLAATRARSCGRDILISLAVDERALRDPDQDVWALDDYANLGREAFHYAGIALGRPKDSSHV